MLLRELEEKKKFFLFCALSKNIVLLRPQENLFDTIIFIVFIVY